jgi:hypothetical protein
MSTDHVVPDTLAQAAAAQLSVELLPGSYDIDYAADLKHLIGDLNLLPDTVAGHTRAFLAENLSDWDVV